VHAGIDVVVAGIVVVVVVVDVDDVVEDVGAVVVLDVLVLVVDGSGASPRTSVNVSNDSGLPGQSPRPLPALHVSVWGPSGPRYSRAAVHDPTFAVSFPLKSPPVSRGFSVWPRSPSTVPVVPFSMVYTPVTW
jgi:hypothetical protein